MASSRNFLLVIVVCVILLCGSRGETHQIPSSNDEMNSVCLEPKEVGPCRAAMPRFFYNKETKVCEQFTYGGCKGNENNFVKKEDCEKTCLGNAGQGAVKNGVPKY